MKRSKIRFQQNLMILNEDNNVVKENWTVNNER